MQLTKIPPGDYVMQVVITDQEKKNHVATQSITIRSGDTSEWARILPDSESVWRDVESRLFDLPLQHSRAVDSSVAENLR